MYESVKRWLEENPDVKLGKFIHEEQKGDDFLAEFSYKKRIHVQFAVLNGEGLVNLITTAGWIWKSIFGTFPFGVVSLKYAVNYMNGEKTERDDQYFKSGAEAWNFFLLNRATLDRIADEKLLPGIAKAIRKEFADPEEDLSEEEYEEEEETLTEPEIKRGVLVDKDCFVDKDGTFIPDGAERSCVCFYVKIRTIEGDEEEYIVDEADYTAAEPGQAVTFMKQGEKFLGFGRDIEE